MIPHGIRMESDWIPKGSRAGALYATQRYSTQRHDLSLTLVNADTREDSLATLGQVIDAGLWVTEERHDVVRSGEREPIPAHVRTAIWYRDRGRCELCSARVEGEWHLDHITPWSAGGSDHSTNLRVLCGRHNMERSNRIDPTERPRRAVTWWCYQCYGRDTESWTYTESGYAFCPVHNRNPGRCLVMRGYSHVHETTGEWPSWHRREPVAEARTIAYCAHCEIPSLTDVTL